MANYILNSKKRKFKKRILNFLTRIGFGAGGLSFSGRCMLFFCGILLLSLFFPWIELRFLDNSVHVYTAFSYYMAYIGYGILALCAIIPFFLLSHIKKERVRAYVPFRLSDAQAIVFVSSMLLVALIVILGISGVYNQIALGGVVIRGGFMIAFTANILLLIAGFFLAKNTKLTNSDLYYLDHETQNKLKEYQDILGKGDTQKDPEDTDNMALPI